MHKRTTNIYFSSIHRSATLQQAIVLYGNAFHHITKNSNSYCLKITDVVKDEQDLRDYGVNSYVAMGFSLAVNRNWNSINIPGLRTCILINLKSRKIQPMSSFFSDYV